MKLAYKLGLGVMVAGVVIAVTSGLFGGAFYEALMWLMTLLDAPEEREFLPPSQPEKGALILQLLGGLVFLCGACIISIRLLLGLLANLAAGLLHAAGRRDLAARLGGGGAPGWLGKLAWVAKLGLAAAAIGLLFFVFTAVPELLLYEIFLYEYNAPGIMTTLDTLSRAGLGMFYTGIALLVFGKPLQLALILFLSLWLTRLGLVLLAVAGIGALLGWGTPSVITAVTGGGVLAVGVWRFLTA